METKTDMIPRLLFMLLLAPILSHTQELESGFVLKHGTTILTYVSKDTVWIASDTKTQQIDTKENKTTNITERKIYKTNNMYYAFCGVPSIEANGKEIYNAKSIMEKIINSGANFKEVYNRFNEAIANKLNEFLDSLVKKKNGKNASATLAYFSKNILLEFLIVNFSGEKLNYVSKAYTFKKINEVYSLEGKNSQFFEGEEDLYMIGQREIIKPFLIKNPSYILRKSQMKERLICLINMESIGNPNNVGMPADVFVIFKNGYKSFLNNKSCIIK